MKNFLLTVLTWFCGYALLGQIVVTEGESYNISTIASSDILVSADEEGYSTLLYQGEESIVRKFTKNHELLSETRSTPQYDKKAYNSGVITTVGERNYVMISDGPAKQLSKKLKLVAGEIVDGEVTDVRSFYTKDYSNYPKGRPMDIWAYHFRTNSLRSRLSTSEDGQQLALTIYNGLAQKRSIQKLEVVVFDDALKQVWSNSGTIQMSKIMSFKPTKTLLAADQTAYVFGNYIGFSNEQTLGRSVFILSERHEMVEYKLPPHSKADMHLINQANGGGCLLLGVKGTAHNSRHVTGVFRVRINAKGEVLENITTDFKPELMSELDELKGKEWAFFTEPQPDGNILFFLESIKLGSTSRWDNRGYVTNIKSGDLVVLTYDENMKPLNELVVEKSYDGLYNPFRVFVSSHRLADKIFLLIKDETSGIIDLAQKGYYEIITLSAEGKLLARESFTKPKNYRKLHRRNMRMVDDGLIVLIDGQSEVSGVHISFDNK